jgi:hypothetical protein
VRIAAYRTLARRKMRGLTVQIREDATDVPAASAVGERRANGIFGSLPGGDDGSVSVPERKRPVKCRAPHQVAIIGFHWLAHRRFKERTPDSKPWHRWMGPPPRSATAH